MSDRGAVPGSGGDLPSRLSMEKPDVRFLGPGSEFPSWLEGLEQSVLFDPWHKLGGNECLWAVDGLGYAQWLVALSIHEAELLRIAVAPQVRGKGLGRYLLRESTQKLVERGAELMRLEVRVSNHAARQLYASEGWRLVGLRKGYYRDGEDAALYELSI